MDRSTQFVHSYSGEKIGPEFGVPTIQDISVQLGRICRYGGACRRFWPVLLHSMVVADLVPNHLKVYALLHDSCEILISDVPRGFKCDELIETENFMMERILDSFCLPPLVPEDKRLVKIADDRALLGEIWTVGAFGIQSYYVPDDREVDVENMVLGYAAEFPPAECISPDGLAVMEFTSRFYEYEALV